MTNRAYRRPIQLPLSSLFVAMTLVAIGIVSLQFCAAWFREVAILSMCASLTLALLGLGLVLFSLILAFSIATVNQNDPDMTHNLKQCGLLALVGLLGVLQLFACAAILMMMVG